MKVKGQVHDSTSAFSEEKEAELVMGTSSILSMLADFLLRVCVCGGGEEGGHYS